MKKREGPGVMKFKKSILLLLAALMVLFSFSVAGCSSGAQKNIVIGVVGPMTGDNAVWGQYEWKTAQLAADEINAAGGVLGKQIVLVQGDDKGDPKEAATVAQSFVAKKVNAVIGPIFSSATLAAGPIFNQAHIPEIVVLASNPKVAQIGDYTFRINVNDAIAGAQTGQYIVQKMNAKKIGVIFDNNDYAIGVKDALISKATELGAQITDVETYVGGQDRDFSVQLTKIAATKPDVIFCSSYSPEGAMIAQQARGLGINTQLVFPDASATPDFLKLAGDAANGAILTTYFNRDIPDPKAKALVDKYEAKYNEPTFVTVPYTYDAIYVMADSIKRAGSLDPAKIRDAIGSTKDFPGVTGPITVVNRDRPEGWNVVLQVENGQFKVIDMISK